MTELRARLQAALGAAYAIERELGGGGMSRVYVARDEALGRDVVIKLLSPELSATLSADRFTREIKLAAALQEPHIVPVLSAGLTGEGLPYYTMPFVRGDSLRARLSAGRVPLGEGIGILRNVAQALAYAHGQGIVHRDIKPENVLISSGTAVVTDFGIAKALAVSRTEAPGGTLTQVGTSLGTPAYMAPEQAAGDEVDARADLYSWGVMAYELLTGTHPFSDRKTLQQMIAAHIAEAPKDPLERLQGDERKDPTARRLAALAMRCLEKQAAARPASALELLHALDAVVTPSGGSDGRAVRFPGRTALIGSGIVAVATVAMLFAWSRRAPVVEFEPKRVVVATFENKSGDPSLDPLGVMAADWIARGLANTGIVDVGGTAAELASRGATSRSSGGPNGAAVGGAAALQALARDAKAGIVISGAYYRQGDSVLFQADFTDAAAGKLVQSVGPVSASASAPLDGVERLRQRVIGSLALLVDSTLAGLATATSRPPTMEAYREFLIGEDLFYKDGRAAIQHFIRAASLDSTYVYPLLRVVTMYSLMRDGRAADSVARIVSRKRALLSSYEQAYLDFSRCSYSNDQPGCLSAARQMVALAPSSQFAAYLLALAERINGRLRAADSIFTALDPEGGALRGRLYFYQYWATANHMMEDHTRELQIVQRARASYPTRLFLFDTELRALAALGRTTEIEARVTESLSMPQDLERRPAQVAAGAVFELRAHGFPAAADALAARMLAWAAARPAEIAGSVAGRRDLAVLLSAARDWEALQGVADALVAAAPDDTRHLRWQGVAFAMRGRRAEAEGVVRRIERGDHRLSGGEDLRARATILAALGEKVRAMSLMQVSFGSYDDSEAHGSLLFDMMDGYPPFLEFFKPRG